MFPMGDDKKALMQCKNELLVVIWGVWGMGVGVCD